MAALAALVPLLLGPGRSAAKEVVLWPAGFFFWDRGRSSERIAREFERFELRALEGGILEWAFRLRPGQPPFCDIFLRREIPAPFDALVVELRLARGRPFTFAVKMGDSTGREYFVKVGKVEPSRKFLQLEIPLSQFVLAPWMRDDPDGMLTFPARYLALIAFDISPKVDYRVLVRKVGYLPLPPPRARISGLRLSRRARAGGSVEVAFGLELLDPVPWPYPLSLVLCGEEDELRWELLPPPGRKGWPRGFKVRVERGLEVDRFAWGGGYRPSLRFGPIEVRILGVSLPKVTIERIPKGGEPVEAKVSDLEGAPGLFVRGRPVVPLVYMTYKPNERYFRQFAEAGVRIYSFPATCSEHHYPGLARPVWVAPSKFDFGEFDERVRMILRANPRALIFPRVYIGSPKWWDERHPDELVRFEDADSVPKLPSGKQWPSFASKVWLRDMGYALRRLIRHVEGAPYADHIIGYHIASGTTEEWMYWGANEGKFCDYSPAALRAFREWLRGKYRTVEALRRAWGDPNVSFETAEVPPFSKRVASEHGEFRDPVRARDVIDYHLFLSDITADAICHFARIVKEETKGRAIVGTFYGYLLQLVGEQRQQNAGHLALRKVLRCPYVDFLCSPTSYWFRRLDDLGYVHFMSLTDSVKLHGKLWMDENDIRTHLVPGPVGGWGKQPSLEGTVLIERREFAAVEAMSCGMWWFDMGGGWFDEPRLMGEISSMMRIGREVLGAPRGPVDEIAVVVDPKSLAYMRTANQSTAIFMHEQLPQLGRIGAPVGYYDLADLDKLGRHKFFIFLNCFAPTDEEIRAIERVVKRPGKVALWFYAPGLISEAGLSERRMRQLTGLPLRFVEGSSPCKMVWTDAAEGRFPGVRAGEVFGSGRIIASRVYAEEGEGIEVWARYRDDGRPAMVARNSGGFLSVWCGAGPVPANVLHELARRAKVHLYLPPGDLIYANEGLLAIWSAEGGERRVSLPRRARRVVELFSRKAVCEGSDEFTFRFPPKETALFLIEG